jgi:hypothetical protein
MVAMTGSWGLADLANLVTIIGLPLALWGLYTVAQQMRNDRLSVSAGAIANMRASIMERVDLVDAARQAGSEPQWRHGFLELTNDLEMACAIYLDGQMSGRSGKLAKDMICDFLQMINDDEDLKEELARAIHADDTYTNIRDFREKVRR